MKRKHKKFPDAPEHVSAAKTVMPSELSKPLGIKFLLLSQLLIIALGFGAYFNSLNGQFLYDDSALIEQNKLIKDPSQTLQLFTKDILAGTGNGVSNFYRPLQMVSYALDYDIFKLDARGYHLTNVVLHVMMVLCVFWLIETLFSSAFLSFMTAALYAVHPVHTEAVSYISGRADPLAGFFMLLSMIIYIRLDQQQCKPWWLLIMGLGFAGALLSKEYSLILPLLLVWYHLVFTRKINKRGLLTVTGLAALYIVLRLTYLKFWTPSPSPDTMLDRLPGFLVAQFNYFRLLLWPFGLHMEYGSKLFDWGSPQVLFGLVVVCAILILGFVQRKNKIILFSIGWYFLGIFPESNLFKINAFMAEHFLYVPSIGFFLLVSYFLDRIYVNQRYKIIALVMGGVFILFFLVLTIRQNRYWHDPLSFYQMTLSYSSNSANAYNNLGEIYRKQGKFSEAMEYFQKAIAIEPRGIHAYFNRGRVYMSQGHWAEALKDFTKAINIQPAYMDAYQARAEVYIKEDRYDLAVRDYDKYLTLDAGNEQIFAGRGFANDKLGNYAQAILDFNQAIKLNPSSGNYYDRGIVYFDEGRYDLAITDYNKSLALDGGNKHAYNKRAGAYLKKGDYDLAVADINNTINIDPKDADAYFTRGYVYFLQGKIAKTIADFNKAIRLRPDFAQAYYNLGRIYRDRGETAQAIQNFSKVIALRPTPEAFSDIARTYCLQKNYAQAIANFNKAIELKPDYSEAYLNRGSAYAIVGNSVQAIQDFDKAIEIKPDFGQAYANRAVFYYSQKEYGKAWDDVNNARHLGTNINPSFLEALKTVSGTHN